MRKIYIIAIVAVLIIGAGWGYWHFKKNYSPKIEPISYSSDNLWERLNKKISEAQDQDKCIAFINAEVKSNITDYINIVFKNSDYPTINDYHRLEGVNSEGELEFLQHQCILNSWNINSEECINYHQAKYEKDDYTSSEYLLFLRNIINNRNDNIEITQIIFPENLNPNELQTIIIKARYGDNNLEFQHALDTCCYPIGFIMLTKINGETIPELVKNKQGWDISL